MKSAAHDFPSRARTVLRNPDLARAMARASTATLEGPGRVLYTGFERIRAVNVRVSRQRRPSAAPR